MSEKKIHLRIVTPTKTLYDQEAEMVVFRAEDGEMGILPGHENAIAALGYGPLKIYGSDDTMEELAVLGGFAKVEDNRVTVLSDAAEWPGEIDLARAEKAKERAEERLKRKNEYVDLHRAELSLRRALVRIEVSTYPIISKGKKQ